VIIDSITSVLEQERINVFTNEKISPGDGGVSVGQVYLLALKKNGFY